MVQVPNRDRKSERREATRVEILEAAWMVADRQGIAGLTLREVALGVGMKAPSLYSHFGSKHAIYDAMFEQAWTQYAAVFDDVLGDLPPAPREALLQLAQTFFDFATANPARHQLMNERVIPGFEPTPSAYLPAVTVLERFHTTLRGLGVDDPAGLDLATGLIGGLINQQMANDSGGSRWRDLLPRVVNMYADEMGLTKRTWRTT